MNEFKDYITEAKIPTVGMVKKLIKSLDYELILPEFFDVEKKNSDAGVGGYDYIQVYYSDKEAKSPKRASDVRLALLAISNKWSADTSKAGIVIIK